MTKSLEKQLIDRHNLAGKSFGRWTVLRYLGAGIYECECDCGHIGTKKTTELTNMRSMQCGTCRRRELRNITKGRSENNNIGLSTSKWTNSIYSIKKEDLDE